MKSFQTSVVWALLAIVALSGMFVLSRYNESQAQTPTSNSSGSELEVLKGSIDNFFETLSNPSKGTNVAIDAFLKDSTLLGNEKTKTKFAEGLKTINSNFGEYVSYEPIGTKMVGSDLVVFRYLYKCQDYPVVWYFTFYRPRGKGADLTSNPTYWRLIGFRYDTNLDAALLDASFDMRN